ncbi:MAG TPA: ABC transporter ATP-binding protein [Candidatus Saccharimonadales bacterium]|nr:ABC transporter ATP-binding protein [Candidatus Saccharimonadales bacterium]
MQKNKYLISLKHVTKKYGQDSNVVTALSDVNLDFLTGSFTAIMGPSGSGKSTMLQCAAGLDQPTSGSILFDNTELTSLNEHQLTLLRRDQVGFIFQSFNLLPSLSAQQNVALPLRLAGIKPSRLETLQALQNVGLAERSDHKPGELSGGQQQRVAIARALIAKPKVIFADEPTGALDIASGRDVLQLLKHIAQNGQTIIMVTHDPNAASYADKVIFLADGKLAGELKNPKAHEVAKHLAELEIK